MALGEQIMMRTTVLLLAFLPITLVSSCREAPEPIPAGSFRLTAKTLVDTKGLVVKHATIEAAGERTIKVREDGSESSVSPLVQNDADMVRVEITFVATLVTSSDGPNMIKWLIQLKSRDATAGGPSTFPVEAETLDDILQLDLPDGTHPLNQDLVVGRFQGKPVVLSVK